MLLHKINPVDSVENLRNRVERLLSGNTNEVSKEGQLTLDISYNVYHETDFSHPSRSITEKTYKRKGYLRIPPISVSRNIQSEHLQRHTKRQAL